MFRFPLWMLLSVITLLCVVGAWVQNRTARQQRAVAILEETGAGVYYDWTFAGAEYPGPGWWQEFIRWPCFRSVRSVTFPYVYRGNGVTSERVPFPLDSEALAALREFPNVKYIDLGNTDLTLEERDKLRHELPGCKVAAPN